MKLHNRYLPYKEVDLTDDQSKAIRNLNKTGIRFLYRGNYCYWETENDFGFSLKKDIPEEVCFTVRAVVPVIEENNE